MNKDGLKGFGWLALMFLYWVGHVATFGYLTFFDGYRYNWWNWIIALVVNELMASIWPIYWLILRPLFH